MKVLRARSGGKVAPAEMLGSVMLLLSWTAVAQLLSAAAMLVLPRLFDPQVFGTFSIYSGVVVLGGVIAAARYEFAIGLPSRDREAAALFGLCLLLSLVVGLCATLLFALLPEGNVLFIRFAELRPWWIWVAAGATAIAWFNAANYLALRYGCFGAVGQSKALIALSTGVGQTLAGLFVTQSAAALIVPFLVGQLVGFAMLLAAMSGRSDWAGGLAQIGEVARRYARFPKYVAPGSLLDGVAVLLPLAAVATTLSIADAGVYALADRTLRMPVTLIGSSMLQVFYKRLSEIRGDAKACRALLLTTWRNLALAAVLPGVALMMFGEPIFAWLFGASWGDAGRSAETMVVGVCVFFVSYPTSNILVVNERTRSFLIWQVAQLVAMSTALVAAAALGGGLPLMVRCIVVAQVCVGLFSMVLQWQAAGQTRAEPEALAA